MHTGKETEISIFLDKIYKLCYSDIVLKGDQEV